MPLSAAARWIASEGGTIPITADESCWRPAFEKLLAKIVLGKLPVNGRADGLPEAIPGDKFVSIAVGYPYSNSPHLWTGDGPYLDCRPFVDLADWGRTGGDKLFGSGREQHPKWTHLQVSSSAVARLFRFKPRRTARDERAATAALTTRLGEQPNLKVASARQYCEEYKFGRVVFNRVWQNARKSAGLPTKASPGRPRKSQR
jgi:hypothetical protein